MFSSRPILAAAVLVAGLALAGCSATPATAPTAENSAPAAPQQEGNFCADFEANGGGGASIRPVAIFYVKEDLQGDVTSQLDVMGDLTPPAELTDAWAAHKTYLEALLPLIEALPAGGMLSAASEGMPEDPNAYQGIVDYYFDNC